MSDPIKIALAVQGGLSPICATCKKFWGARERNVPDGKCLAVSGCGGPLSGGNFHEYEGPISDFTRWCFVCGADSSFGVQVDNRPRVIGVCEEHVRMLAELRPVSKPGLQPQYAIKSKSGTLTIREILGPEKKSLFKAIQEVEDHYAEKDGREE